jgi:hypothetical protein
LAAALKTHGIKGLAKFPQQCQIININHALAPASATKTPVSAQNGQPSIEILQKLIADALKFKPINRIK